MPAILSLENFILTPMLRRFAKSVYMCTCACAFYYHHLSDSYTSSANRRRCDCMD